MFNKLPGDSDVGGLELHCEILLESLKQTKVLYLPLELIWGFQKLQKILPYIFSLGFWDLQ